MSAYYSGGNLLGPHLKLEFLTLNIATHKTLMDSLFITSKLKFAHTWKKNQYELPLDKLLSNVVYTLCAGPSGDFVGREGSLGADCIGKSLR